MSEIKKFEVTFERQFKSWNPAHNSASYVVADTTRDKAISSARKQLRRDGIFDAQDGKLSVKCRLISDDEIESRRS
jgi:hypothetical protein